MTDIIKEQFLSDLQAAEIIVPSETIDRLISFIAKLLEVNQHTNLTAITDFQEAIYKHLYDALLISKVEQFIDAELVLDVGSGGGIPAIPLAIAFPSKTIYSLEATQKKVHFQEAVKDQLQIENFHPIWNRAEVLAHDPNFRGRFDIVTARALAATNILNELTLPYLKIGGYAVLYKGKDAAKEIDAADQSFMKLKANLVEMHYFNIPHEYGERNLVVIQKTEKTPLEYPRKPGIPQKRPIN